MHEPRRSDDFTTVAELLAWLAKEAQSIELAVVDIEHVAVPDADVPEDLWRAIGEIPRKKLTTR